MRQERRRLAKGPCATLARARWLPSTLLGNSSHYPYGKNMMNKRFPVRQGAVVLLAMLALVSCGDDEATRVSSGPDTACQALTNDGSTVVVGSNLPGDPALPE